jgi:hypothetical protein
MSTVDNGAQWASGSKEPTTVVPVEPHRRASRRRPGPKPGITSIVVALALLLVASAGPTTPAVKAADDYLLMSRAQLLALPTSGTAWTALKEVANQSLGTPDLCDQDKVHGLRALAAALVYARTGTASYATKAKAGIMAAIKTQTVGCHNAVLSLGRQLPGYVLAADFAGLSGANDSTFRSWLSSIRTKYIGGHSAWDSLTKTHKDAPNNWGAHAGAARIAASLYLGDTADVSQAARVTRGFLGDRSAYAGFRTNLDSSDWSWSCGGPSTYTPVNKSCTKSGINVDGAFIADMSRSGSLTWPPGDTGVAYHVDALAAVAMQVELLNRHGYPGAWDWSNKALRRAAMIVQRSDADGGDGWNLTTASSQIPWLLNLRYGKFLPTRHQPLGRGICCADWLWGAGSGATLPAPTVTAPTVRLSTTSKVPKSGVPIVIGWALKSTADGLRRYDLQQQVNGGTWKTLKLDSSTSTTHRITIGTSSSYAYRVRAVDRSGRVGGWQAIKPKTTWRVSDSSASLGWSGPWTMSSSTSYLDGKLHRSGTDNADMRLVFTGSSVAWVSPIGSNLGTAHVFIDGSYERTVDLHGSSASRRIVFAANLSEGKHSIRIRVTGAGSHPVVTIDGLYVVRAD